MVTSVNSCHFVYYYWLVTGSIFPKIIENENKLLYVSFLSPVMSAWENALFEKKAELTYNCCLYPSCYWHYMLNLPWRQKTNFDVTLWKVTTGTLQIVQGHRNLARDTLSGKPPEDFSFLGKAVFVLILQIVDLKSNRGKAIKREKKNN